MGRKKGGKTRDYSKEEKLGTVKRNLNGESLRGLEKETGIANSVTYQWSKRYLTGGEQALENKKKTRKSTDKIYQ